ncbi:hypothetical protein M9458_013161 [Cirrhinus mrigala]|uniref:Uncharacterized protein n=1 Tax=Cirrhinus mrigala TaxID=683832 RepID=A0ABD0QW45_CIRMR
MDREVVLEALSALLETNVKPYNAFNENLDQLNLGELNILNFLQIALGKALLDLSHRPSQQALMAGFNRDVRQDMLVDLDDFFEPRFDYDFTRTRDNSICMRGNEPYKRPCGWYRIALKVLDKYPDGNAWLGVDGWRSHTVAGEWPVSYHGTSIEGATGIVRSHYKAGPREQYGRGIYSTSDIDLASGYSKIFTSKKNGRRYRVLMQNRINPAMRKMCDRQWLIEIPEGTSPAREKEIVERSIRPYGILLKQV